MNKTCFHGHCQHVDDILLGWYEFCLCEQSYVGIECDEQTIFSRTDWFVLLSIVLFIGGIGLCFISIPFFYYILKEDFYPQIIECARTTPYVEIQSLSSPIPNTDIRLYRIPSEHLSRRRTILDGLVPLHSISSLAYLTLPRRTIM